jgi:hypothetical protein
VIGCKQVRDGDDAPHAVTVLSLPFLIEDKKRAGLALAANFQKISAL